MTIFGLSASFGMFFICVIRIFGCAVECVESLLCNLCTVKYLNYTLSKLADHLKYHEVHLL